MMTISRDRLFVSLLEQLPHAHSSFSAQALFVRSRVRLAPSFIRRGTLHSALQGIRVPSSSLCNSLCAVSTIPDTVPSPSSAYVLRRSYSQPRRFASSSASPGNSYREEPSGRLSQWLAAVGLATVIGGIFTFRWYISREPDVESVSVKMAKPRDQTPATEHAVKAPETPVVESTSVSAVDTASTATTSPPSPSSTDAAESPVNVIPVEAEPVETAPDTEDVPSIQYINPDKAGFPNKVRYLIIGAGSAGLSGARSIRASDPQSRVLMIAGGTGASDYAEPGLPETDHLEPPPYLRPPLSKELWRRNRAREARLLQTQGDIRRHSWLYYEAESFFLKPEELNTAEFGGVSLLRGDPVIRLDPDRRIVTLASGRQIAYERCLLATGGRPKRLPQLERCSRTGEDLVKSGHVSYFRTLGDYKRLRDVCDRLRKSHGTVAIIGGGFLGSELAVSLQNEPTAQEADVGVEAKPDSRRLRVLHLFRESAPLGQVLPPCLAAATGRFEASCGTEVWTSSELVGASLVPEATPAPEPTRETGKHTLTGPLQPVVASQLPEQQRVRLRVRREHAVEEVEVDHVVCVIGIEPNTDLAASAGLEIDPVHGGFLVNAEMETRAGVYAAGDAASYWDPVLGCRRRVEHLNFAEETGYLAGRNMAASLQPSEDDSATQRYHYQSSMWSTLGSNLSWDAVGNVDARRLETRAFFLTEPTPNPSEVGESTGTTALRSIPTADLGRYSGRGVVFYLTPQDKRLVGVLLWNLPDELYTDPKYSAPARLNLARSLLAEKRCVGQDPRFASPEAELSELAARFDLGGELARDYAELKAFMETQAKEQQDQGHTPSSDSEPKSPAEPTAQEPQAA